jgi:hypothetical protein
VTRAYGSLLNVTPGLTVDNNGLAVAPTMTFFTAHGGNSNEGRMQINGMTVAAAFNGGGVSSLTYDTTNVDEVSVLVSGGLGESETGGPTMNIVPRSGANRFNGQAFYSDAGKWSNGDNIGDDAALKATVGNPPQYLRAWDTSVSVGGPIKRDRSGSTAPIASSRSRRRSRAWSSTRTRATRARLPMRPIRPLRAGTFKAAISGTRA